MSTNAVAGATTGAFLGLVAGYILFGQVNGQFVPPGRLLFGPTGFVENLEYWAFGLGEIRRHVLWCGLFGAVIGAVIPLLTRMGGEPTAQ